MIGPTATGLVFVLVAGILQGLFLLPMGFVRLWRWEHSWLAFSLFGMLVFNWAFASMTLPHIFDVYRAISVGDLGQLVLFGFGWGAGAVFFGLGMERLGLSLGYPIIMGLIASLGALVPLLVFYPKTLLSAKGAIIVAGTLIVVAGIVLCSRAGVRKETARGRHQEMGRGATIAVAAGVLSSLPNVGMTFGQGVIAIARVHGAPANMASNVVWALFFTAGFFVNAGYCLYLMFRHRTGKLLFGPGLARNLALTALMGLFWIASFYSYGIGAARIGALGPVIGWPLFIACAITVGNLVGFWRGEWRSAPAAATALLGRGLLVLFSAVALIAASGILP